MNPYEQRIAIAEVCGWQINPTNSGEALRNPKGEIVNAWFNESWRLPDYLNDLNAMHEAEKVLTPEQLPAYECELCEVVARIYNDSWIAVVRATAAQRAEAFLRTLNLWTYDVVTGSIYGEGTL